MKWITFKLQRAPGFRFNLYDAGYIVMMAGIVAFTGRWTPGTTLWAVTLHVGVTFFLFCNVFRIGNLLEALWYLPFAAVAITTLSSLSSLDPTLFWMIVLLVLEPWKWILIAYRIWRGPYVGAGYALANRWRNRQS